MQEMTNVMNGLFRWICGLGLLGIFFLSGCGEKPVKNESIDSDPDPRHERVIFTEQPGRHAIVSWTTMMESEKNTVYYGTEPGGRDPEAYKNSIDSVQDGKITMEPEDIEEGVPEAYFHHAELDELEPSTTYYVLIESDGEFIEPFHFITAPVDGREFKIISAGDSRLGGAHPRYAGRTPHEDRKNMNRRIATLLEKNPDIIAFAHGGDWGDTGDWRHLYWWFEDNELIRTENDRLLPFVVTRGNHDMSVGFEENFWLGSLSESEDRDYYFKTNLNGGSSLVTLNTEISMTGDQLSWLKQTLPELRSGSRWLLVQYHRPAWPAVKDFDRGDFVRIRQNWVPLFEKSAVDLVLESDGHALKRTVPIHDNVHDPERGIVYIGEGGLGVPQRKPDRERWFVQEPGMTESVHHVWLLDFSEEMLRMTAIGIDGEVLDESVLKPRELPVLVE